MSKEKDNNCDQSWPHRLDDTSNDEKVYHY